MLEKSTIEFIDVLSSKAPVPGGGGASAAVGAFSAALGMMVTNLTIGKKKFADVEDRIIEIRSILEEKRDNLIELVDEDAKEFEPLSKAYSLPKETKEEQEYKKKIMEKALKEACMPPVNIMETVYSTLDLLDELADKGSRLALSDVGVAALFAAAAIEGASLNVFINTKSMTDKEAASQLNNKAENLIYQGKEKSQKIYEKVLAGIK